MVKIICTDSYHYVYHLLCRELKGKNSLAEKNLVFCDEKSSLMAENRICSCFIGTFNTEVYSFGNFLRVKGGDNKSLSKEGSSMVIKKLLGELSLKTLNKGKDIAPSVYELIAQLKSAGVTSNDIIRASEGVVGVLKNKLEDIGVIFSAYENYLCEKDIEDQSSALSRLPETIEKLDEIENTNVFLVGQTRFTLQNLLGIKALIKKAKSVTAILPYGENHFAFVNETIERLKTLCNEMGEKVATTFENSPKSVESKIILDKLFNPLQKIEKVSTDKIALFTASSEDEEAEKIASIIRTEVLKGKRYKDFTVALSSPTNNSSIIKAFNLLNVPYYVDTEYKVDNHPLITLIFSYIDIFIKNFEREKVFSLIKNPLFSSDKEVNDAFINYVYKYNVNYSQFMRPFTFATDNESEFILIEGLRKKLSDMLSKFNLTNFLNDLNVKEKLELFSLELKKHNRFEERAVSEQIYSKVDSVLKEMESILGNNIEGREFRATFLSGINALKLSIIPQYNDAVFVGNFKECAQSEAENLFVCSLTSSVPGIKEDTALLSDTEIDKLSELKVIVEPKIKIVNHRVREEIAISLSSFKNKLYLSYPTSSLKGDKNLKSEIITFFENNFTLIDFPKTERYLSYNQSLKNFAIDCANFTEWKDGDINEALRFHLVDDKGITKNILSFANGEMVKQIENAKVLVNSTISPTTIEEFYKCPFRSYMGHALGVKEREVGEVSSLAVGNIMHDIFYLFVSEMDKIKEDSDIYTLFLSCKENVLKDERYSKFLSSPETETNLSISLEECKKHCVNTYNFLNSSHFKAEKENLERKFVFSLADGKVKLGGKIDRVDTFDDYFRVIDYKTGKVDDSNEGLFSGIKMQLWLYALSIKDKKLAGVYYYDVQDEYKSNKNKQEPIFKGKTLDDIKIINLQDKTIEEDGVSKYLPLTVKDGEIKGAVDERTLLAYLKYAEKMSEKAVDYMNKGTIIPSPIKGACEWCKYKSCCLFEEGGEREIGKVNDSDIVNAVYGGDENA